MEFVTKKGKIGGDKRKISFQPGTGDNMVLKTSGIITKDAAVSIGDGLPNTTSKEWCAHCTVQLVDLFQTNSLFRTKGNPNVWKQQKPIKIRTAPPSSKYLKICPRSPQGRWWRKGTWRASFPPALHTK